MYEIIDLRYIEREEMHGEIIQKRLVLQYLDGRGEWFDVPKVIEQ